MLDQSGDNAPTPPRLAKSIVKYFYRHHDLGFVMDPCSGDLRWYRWMKEPRAECEIQRGMDCRDYVGPAPVTMMTNPPWSKKSLTPILEWMVRTATRHIVLLVADRKLMTRKRHAMFRDAGWGLRTRILLPRYRLPGAKQTVLGGYMIVVDHFEKGWKGDITHVDWTTSYKPPASRR